VKTRKKVLALVSLGGGLGWVGGWRARGRVQLHATGPLQARFVARGSSWCGLASGGGGLYESNT
jgi:hypothetical protein